MDIYKIYVATKKRDGSVVKSECITIKSEDKESAIDKAISRAKFYGYKGKVHICSVHLHNEDGKYVKI